MNFTSIGAIFATVATGLVWGQNTPFDQNLKQGAVEWLTIFKEDFERGISRWSVRNFQERLSFEIFDTPAGSKALRVKNNLGDWDTWFSVALKQPVAVMPNHPFRFSFRWNAVKPHALYAVKPSPKNVGNYVSGKGYGDNRILWYDKEKKIVDSTIFGYDDNLTKTTLVCGRTPTNAVSAVIQFGFDQPDIIIGGDYLELQEIRFVLANQPTVVDTDAVLQKPPEIIEHSASRTADAAAPIWFRFADHNTINRKTLRVLLDAKDITTEITEKPDGRFVYQPPAPLTPWEIGRNGFVSWIQRPNKAFVAIHPIPGRPDGAHPGLRVTRQGGLRKARAVTNTNFRVVSPLHPVVPGGSYRLAYWSRHPIDLQRIKGNGGIYWLDASQTPIAAPQPIPFGGADESWHQHSIDVKAPAGTAYAWVELGFDNPCLAFGEYVDFADLTFEGPSPETPDEKRPNLHKVTVRAANMAGRIMSTNWFMFCKAPRTSGIVTIREDGMLLIDKKPFFPIGIYAVHKCRFNDFNYDKAFSGMRAAGFNTAHTYVTHHSRGRAAFGEFLEAAARHDIRLFVPADDICNRGDENLEAVARGVAQFDDASAVIAWYVGDDTSAHVAAPALRRVHDTIKEVDPSRITVQADVGRLRPAKYEAYVNSTDGILLEEYPVRPLPPPFGGGVSRINADWHGKGRQGKTLWSIIQYFRSKTNDGDWPRYPTRDELWAMSYLSIIHGANGITFFLYSSTSLQGLANNLPESWDTISALATELNSLHDVLVTPKGKQPEPPQIIEGPQHDAYSFPPLHQLMKEHNEKKWLLVASSVEEPLRAKIHLPNASRVKLEFEQREIALIEENYVVDTFVPFGVHIYSWE